MCSLQRRAWSGLLPAVLAVAVLCAPPLAAQDSDDLALAYASLGMDSLSAEVRDGFQGTEIRIRTSFSHMLPHALVVLRRTEGSGWVGGAWLFSGGVELSDPGSPRRLASCRDADFAEAVLCPAVAPEDVDWGYVGALAVDSLDVLHLPDPSELPLPTAAMIDGIYLFAEMASGGRYRAISWINHEVRQEPEARRAYALHRLIDVLTRPGCWKDHLSAPWPERMARIYGGRPPPECSR